MEICYNIGRGKFQPFHLEQSDEAIAATHAEHAKQVCGQNRGICPKPLASLVALIKTIWRELTTSAMAL